MNINQIDSDLQPNLGTRPSMLEIGSCVVYVGFWNKLDLNSGIVNIFSGLKLSIPDDKIQEINRESKCQDPGKIPIEFGGCIGYFSYYIFYLIH